MSLAALLLAVKGLALTNNVALTPPMGWNDWNEYGCGISESIVTNTVNLVATNGLKAAGYQFIDIDDGWASSRNSNGIIQAYSIPSKFPDGIAFLANYAHSNGLKLGIYTDHGTNTCSSCISGATPPKDPGSYGYEYVDAFTYASWNVDYLKEDNCNVPANANSEVDYSKMSDGLMLSGRPIVFCLCGGGAGNEKGYESWSPVLGNYWRTTGDIGDSYASMISHIDPNSTTAFAAGPGRWNDPDMLEVGNGGMTATQNQTHFTMWCIMAAPLIMGNNLSTVSAQSLAILTNAEAIAVDQDAAGEEGVKTINTANSVGTNEVWGRTLGYDFTTKAVVLFNRAGPATNITVNWTNIGLQAGPATVRDLWAHVDLGTFTNSFTTNVGTNATVMLKVVGTPPVLPVLGTNYLTSLQAVYAYTGYGSIVPNKSIGGNTITLNGVTYPYGIGVNSFAGSDYDLGGICSRFQATIGVDDEVGAEGSVIFEVFADGLQIYNSGVMVGGGPAQRIDLDVTGVRRLILGVGDADDNINYDHADWADALVIVSNTTPQAPYAPGGLTASPGNAIILTWNSALAANTYNVQRATTSGGPYTIITNIPITTFADSNVTVGTTYYYVVSSVNITGRGSNSVEVSATPCLLPAVPANVVATASNTSAVVTWSASAGATTYIVERFTPGTPPILIASNVTAVNFTDATGAVGQTNYYLVSAVNDCNQSGWSAFAPLVIPLPPAPPVYWTNVVTTATQSWNVNANWTNSTTFPNSPNVLAVISENIAAPQTINLNQAITISSMNIGAASGAAPYTIAANGGSLAFAGATNTVELTQLASSAGDVLATPISLETNLVVNNDSVNPLTLAGTLSSSGGMLTLGGGVLQVGNSTTSGSLGSVNVIDNGTLVFACSGSVTASGVISGSGSLTQNGSGTLTLSAIEAYTGLTIVSNGTLLVMGPNQADTGISSSSGVIIYTNGTLMFNSDNAGFGTGSAEVPVTINAGGTLTGLSSADSGAGTSSHLAGQLTLNGGTLTDGGTQIQATFGTWDLTGGVVVNSGPNNSTTSTIACLDIVPNQAGGTVFNVTASSPPTPSGTDLLVSGSFINGSSLHDTGIIKAGSGTMVLHGVNTYAGATAVQGGTLALSGSGSINSSASITVNNATLDVSGLLGAFSYPNALSLTNGTLNLAGVEATNISLSINNSTLNIQLPGTNLVTGALTTGGPTNTIVISEVPGVASYPTDIPLIKYSSFANTNGANILANLGVSLPILGSAAGYLTNNAANKSIDLFLTSGSGSTAPVWNGGGCPDAEWSRPTNWSGNAIGPGIALYFAGTNCLNTTNDTAVDTKYGNITFLPGAGPFVLYGNNIAMGSGIFLNDSSSPETVDLGVDFTSAFAFNGGSSTAAPLIIGGGLNDLGNATTVYLNGCGILSNNLTIPGGAGTGTNALEMTNNSANWTLADNSASSPITLPWGFEIFGGTFNFGTTGDTSGPVFVSTPGNGQIVGNDTLVGIGASLVGTFNMVNGSLTLHARLDTGASISGSVGIVNQTGGTLTIDGQFQGANIGGGSCTLNLSGGNFNVVGNTTFVASRGQGSFTVGGTAVANLATLDVARGAQAGTSCTGVVNLNAGGAMTVSQVSTATANVASSTAGYTGNLNFNGGVLNASGSSTAFITDSTGGGPIPLTLTVKSGGAIVNDNGHAISVLEMLQHDSNLGVTNDGGLTKLGAGTLTLADVNSYTGTTTISNGTLALGNAGSISDSVCINILAGAILNASGRSDGTLTLASGQTLEGGGNITGALTNSAGSIVAPGSSSATGTLTISGAVTMQGAIFVKLSPAGSTNDVLAGSSITYGGTLSLGNLSGAYAAGETFKLFNAGSYHGSFANLTPAIPATGLAWRTNNLVVTGSLSIAAQPTAQPHFGGIVQNGNSLVISGTNGVPSWTYYVLTSTNLSLPLSNWTVAATNVFNGAGNFNFTNFPNPNSPQTFYLLRLQY